MKKPYILPQTPLNIKNVMSPQNNSKFKCVEDAELLLKSLNTEMKLK